MSKKEKFFVFINKTEDGKNNLCGENVAKFRKELHLSQRKLADKLQLNGLDVDKNAIQRIEAGKRFVTDIELVVLAKTLGCALEALLFSQQENTASKPQSIILTYPGMN